jgi:hypothetical protein
VSFVQVFGRLDDAPSPHADGRRRKSAKAATCSTSSLSLRSAFRRSVRLKQSPLWSAITRCLQPRQEGTVTIDKQRVEAVRTLEAMGFTFAGDKWLNTTNYTSWALLVQANGDILHSQLVTRADALAGCTAGSPEEQDRRHLRRHRCLRGCAVAER